MSPDDTQKTTETEVDEGADPIESFFLSLSQNWKELVAGLVIAGLIIGTVMFYQNRRRAARDRAFIQLAMASGPSQFSEIVTQFPGSPAAPIAALMAARTQYDAGNYGEADDLYAEFLKTHKNHFMVPAAQLGRIHCQEATGQTEESLDAYRKFAEAYPAEKGLVLWARLGEARCLRALSRPGEAVSVYDMMLLEQPEGEWKPLIEDLRSVASREADRAPVAAPAAIAVPAVSTPQ